MDYMAARSGAARGLRQLAAAVVVGSLLPAVRRHGFEALRASASTTQLQPPSLRPARSKLRPPHSGSELPQSTAQPAHVLRLSSYRSNGFTAISSPQNMHFVRCLPSVRPHFGHGFGGT